MYHISLFVFYISSFLLSFQPDFTSSTFDIYCICIETLFLSLSLSSGFIKFDDFSSHSVHMLYYSQPNHSDNAMCFQLDYRGVGHTRLIEGSYIGCTECSGFLGFRDVRRLQRQTRLRTIAMDISEGETPPSE